MATGKHTTPDRRITVGTASYPALRTDYLRIGRDVPYIRLRGHWLTAAGFKPEDAVRIRVEEGRLVMTKE